MHVSEIIDGCSRDGVILSLSEAGKVQYEGESYAVSFWLPRIRENKDAIVSFLGNTGVPLEPNDDRCCYSCKFFCRPGRSDGHCTGRTDLPYSYGTDHPFRVLPADIGTNCREFVER